MIITLMQTLLDNKCLDKKPTTILSAKTLTTTSDINIINPVITIDFIPEIINANYCYIPDFNRYYFINNYNLINGNHIVLELTIDVLHTYKNYIIEFSATVVRNENINETFIDDEKYPLSNDFYINAQYFPLTPFTPIPDTDAITNNAKNIIVSIINSDNFRE